MSRVCRHEPDVRAAAHDVSGAPLSAALESHLAACDDCRTVFAIALALRDERAAALASARVPSAGQVWWRAELRARQDAAAAVARPITLVTGLAAAAIVGVLASLVGVVGWWARAWIGPVVTQLVSPVATLPATSSATAWLIVGAVAAMLVATPVLLYVASREE